MIARWLRMTNRALRHLTRGQGGALFMETVVALALFGILGTAVLVGVQTSSMSKHDFDNQSTAENLLRNQIESVFEQGYQAPGGTYQTVDAPSGYTVTVEALEYEPGSTDIEAVRVTVLQDGQPVKVMETLRANR